MIIIGDDFMKNMIHIRNSVIIILCITVILLGIGFIILSIELKKKSDYNPVSSVVFDSVKKTTSVKGSDKEPVSKAEIITSGSEIDMEFNLYSIHDEITYTAEISNKGNIPCEIIDIMESPDYSKSNFKDMIYPVTISLSDIKGKIIPPGDKIDLKIVVYYNKRENVAVTPKNISYKIGLITKSR